MTVYYLDHGAKEGQLTGTLNFTNGSTTVTGTGTAFTTELSVGDYIISDDATNGIQWYKVTAITDDLTLTIDPAFNQATHSATASYNKQSNVTGGGTSTTYDATTGIGAFCHLQQFMDVAAAGDICYVRANQTYYYSKTTDPIADGTLSAPIKIIGDDGTQFGDTFTSKATFDFQNMSSRGIYIYIDNYYEFRNIVIQNVNSDGIYMFGGLKCWFYDLDINNTTVGISKGGNTVIEVENCVFDSNGTGIYIAGGGFSRIRNCTFSNSSTRALYTKDGHIIYLIGCTFTANSRDIEIGNAQDTLSEVIAIGSGITPDSVVYAFDASGEYYASYGVVRIVDSETTVTKNWISEKDTLTVTGNATSSIKVTPRANRADIIRRPVFEWVVDGVTGGVQHTVSIDVMGSGWTTLPTADELWIEVEYISDSVNYIRSYAKSTDVLTANDTWTTFSVTFTPAADGYIVVRGYLEKYESTGVVWFNGEVTVV